MKQLAEIRDILAQNRDALCRKYGVRLMGLFGSFVRGEQGASCDLDVLVEFEDPVDIFEFMDLGEHLEELTGLKVDLVSKDALKPKIGKHILEEVSYL